MLREGKRFFCSLPCNFPTLYNEVLQLKVSELKKWEYLNPNKIQSETITWNRNGNKTDSISITVITSKKNPFVEFNKEKLKNLQDVLDELGINNADGVRQLGADLQESIAQALEKKLGCSRDEVKVAW